MKSDIRIRAVVGVAVLCATGAGLLGQQSNVQVQRDDDEAPAGVILSDEVPVDAQGTVVIVGTDGTVTINGRHIELEAESMVEWFRSIGAGNGIPMPPVPRPEMRRRVSATRAITLMRPDGQVREFDLSAPLATVAQAQLADPPSVMIGVRMESPDESLAGHLGIEADEATMLTAVHEGLPAYLAGLRRYDVIVGAEDSDLGDMDTIRGILQSKKPGDTLSFDVIHQGERRTREITLAPYDASRLEIKVELERWPGVTDESLATFMVGDGGQIASGDALQLWTPSAPNSASIDLQRELERVNERLQRLERLIEQMVTTPIATDPAPDESPGRPER